MIALLDRQNLVIKINFLTLITLFIRPMKTVVDMDMFFMACELLSRPHLKDFPCCVGHNMISTSNYEARKYGVRSAMAGWIGDKLVEELSAGTQKLVHVSSNFELYREKSHIVSAVLRQFDPHCRCMSLDEAYLELGPYLALKMSKGWTHDQISNHLSSATITDGEDHTKNKKDATGLFEYEVILQSFSAKKCLAAANDTLMELRKKVCEATGGLTCSAGLAPTVAMAKIASDMNKPNGQKLVGASLENDVYPFLRPLPTRKIGGIGRVTQKILEAFGIATVQNLWDERALVRFLFKPASAKFLLRASLGGFGSSDSNDDNIDEDDKTKTSSTLNRKGISRERTFTPGQSWTDLNCRLEDIARRLSQDMVEEGVWARTISLKIKLHTFDVLQRARTVESGKLLQSGDDLLRHAAEMLRELKGEHKDSKFSLRLIGIRCSNLLDSAERASLVAEQLNMEKFLSREPNAHLTTKPRQSSLRIQGPKPGPLDSFFQKAAHATNRSSEGNANDIKPPPVAASNQPCATLKPGLLDTPKPGPLDSFFQKADHARNCSSEGKENGMKPPISVDQPPFSANTNPICASVTADRGLPNAERTNCPICNLQLTAVSADALNRALNNHIDACLNGPAVRLAVQEETHRASDKRASNSSAANTLSKGGKESAARPKQKKLRLTEFFTES